MNTPIVREYHEPFTDKVEPGRGLVVIFVESETQRIVLLADTPWNQGASMTNAIEAVILSQGHLFPGGVFRQHRGRVYDIPQVALTVVSGSAMSRRCHVLMRTLP